VLRLLCALDEAEANLWSFAMTYDALWRNMVKVKYEFDKFD